MVRRFHVLVLAPTTFVMRSLWANVINNHPGVFVANATLLVPYSQGFVAECLDDAVAERASAGGPIAQLWEVLAEDLANAYIAPITDSSVGQIHESGPFTARFFLLTRGATSIIAAQRRVSSL